VIDYRIVNDIKRAKLLLKSSPQWDSLLLLFFVAYTSYTRFNIMMYNTYYDDNVTIKKYLDWGLRKRGSLLWPTSEINDLEL
jgi:hypothetical protein